MELGIEKAAKSRFGFENNIKVTIDRSTGNIDIYRVLTIVENPTNHNTEISLAEAIKISKKNEDKKIGDEILETLPTFDFGRKPGANGTFSWEKTDKKDLFNK